MPTPSSSLAIAKLSQAYALIEIEKRGLFGGGLDLDLPRKLYNIRKSVEWAYNKEPSTPSLQGTANYLFALCAPFNLKAEYTLGLAGSGTVTPVAPITAPSPIEFVVSGSSLIPTGGSSIVISTFIGYNLLFVLNNVTQSQINTGGTYFTWNRLNGSFTCFGPANSGDLFQLYPFL